MACLPFLNLVVLGIATMAAIGHKREEKVPPGTMARRHCMESVGLRCANPTYLAGFIKERIGSSNEPHGGRGHGVMGSAADDTKRRRCVEACRSVAKRDDGHRHLGDWEFDQNTVNTRKLLGWDQPKFLRR